MKQKQLNDELTIVGLIFFLLFISYELISYTNKTDKLYNEVIEAKKVAIHLNNRLTTTEYKLNETKEELHSLTSDLEEYQGLKKILKDIRLSWGTREN